MGFLRRFLLAAAAVLLCQVMARSDATLFVQEPYGFFGAINPTGHASVYLSRVCAETPMVLRRCAAGEFGIVISRYSKIGGYDWIAIPLIPYLYAVDNLADVPEHANAEAVAALRDEYRHRNLREIVPDRQDGKSPKGSWVELIGAAYNRKLYGFTIATSEEQDNQLISAFNARKNKSHFNLFYNNCADFSRKILNGYYPGAIRRNYIAEAGITTPRQIVKCLLAYSKEHPEITVSSFFLPQVAGSRRPSHRLNGVSEGFVRSKKYIVPLVAFHPWIAGSIFAIYLANGRFNVAQHATKKYAPADLAAMQDSSECCRAEVSSEQVPSRSGEESRLIPTISLKSIAEAIHWVSGPESPTNKERCS